jgi:hypothetical protein
MTGASTSFDCETRQWISARSLSGIGCLRPSGSSEKTRRILGMDQISYVSPVARTLIGRAAGEIVLTGDREIEIFSID